MGGNYAPLLIRFSLQLSFHILANVIPMGHTRSSPASPPLLHSAIHGFSSEPQVTLLLPRPDGLFLKVQQTNRLHLSSSSMFGVLQKARQLHKKIALGLTVAQPAWSYCHFSWTQWSLWLQCGSAALSACWPAHQKPHEFYSTLAASLVMKPKYKSYFRFLSVTDDQSAVQSQCHRGC